jgi:tetratricopeptide (TPR) repeat protein
MMEQLMGENDFINGTTIVVDDYDEDHELFAPSNTGYKNAWNRLEEKLENGQLSAMNVPHTVTADGRVYCFQQENSQMHNHASDGQKNLEEIFEQGMEYYREGRIQSAIQSFEAVVQQADETSSVNIAESWRMIGLCHTENDEDKVAIVCFIKAVENDSYHLDALLALGTCYMNELDSFKALETLKAWVAHNPSFAGLEVPQDAYSDGSLMDEVMQLMLAVSEYAPTDMDVQVVLGVLYNISNDYSNAVSCFHQALRHNPTSYNLLNKVMRLTHYWRKYHQ